MIAFQPIIWGDMLQFSGKYTAFFLTDLSTGI